MSYTIDECKAVMRETQKILNKTVRNGRRVKPLTAGDARAAGGGTKPPSATELFLDYVVQRQEEDGLTLPEAIRAVSIEQPDLAAAWLQERNRERDREEQVKRKTAARIRNRNRR